MATLPGSPPLQYGLGYRQAQIGNPQQVLQTPMRPGIARPQQNIQQINQPAAQAQQPPQGGSGSYQALVQALAAQQAGAQADRFRRSSQGAFKQPGLAGAAFGGLNSYLAGRKEKQQMEAQKESLRLQDDDARIEEMQERKAIYDTLKSVNPNLSDDQALPMAKAIQAGHAKLEDFIPKAQSQGDLAQEYETLVRIYGEDGAKKKLATKYESKLDGKEGEKFSSAELGKARRNIRNYEGAIKDFKELSDFVKKKGFELGRDIPFLDPENKTDVGTMKAYYDNARNSMRVLRELGVLQQADRELLEDILKDPTSFWGWVGNTFGGNAKELTSVLDRNIEKARQKIKDEKEFYGLGGEPETLHFNTVEEAQAANLPPGTVFTVGK